MHIKQIVFVAISAVSLAGCGASLSGPTTGSLFGAKPAPTAANDSLSRTMGVAATSARAVRCGYNFDPAKLRSQYLASETAANPADAEKLGQVYDTAFRGVAKAVAENGADYCTAQKTAGIKVALNRHLAGDYTPAPPEVVQEDGIFGSWGSSGGGTSSSNQGANMQDIYAH
ncbi:hypothetical protein DLM45_00015 [Hyphomicrobium methylovorum]|uniref:hypothetical protein n=1 Tax=Hyphomicrobium methylovorum TaxID=84 RepID=UPI0015E74FB7|nr:hypothetical protein [Hyphomicrobium methylovorum]MBA2124615.1 hypothetical protein [Hyphomicrobium methylovorum]